MKSEIDRYAADGYRSLGFLGGEPTTYPKLVQSIAHARQQGFTRIAIATNATRLRLAHYTDKVLEAGLTRVTVSMHGHTAELEDKLTRVPGNFEKKCTALRYLVKKRDAGYLADGLSVNIVLNGWNHRALPKMMKFFYEDIGLEDIRVNFVRPEGYAEGDSDLCPRFPVMVKSLIKGIILSETHFKRVFTFGGFPMCVLPEALRKDAGLLSRTRGEYRDLSTACSIRSEGGDLIPPGQTPDPNSYIKGPKSTVVDFDADTNRARFNWQDRKRFDLKARPKPCQACELASVCEGAWKGYLEIWGEADLKPIRLLDTALGS
jgi:MoaA/NifB/PqqE/SkfB family radical SAM enzyme